MSVPVRERLAGLSADVEQVRLAPAADVRARGRSRARRRWAGTAAGLATGVAAAGLGLTSVLGGGPEPIATLPIATLPAAGPSSVCGAAADLTLPASPEEVTIEVRGGAEQAAQVAGELDKRGFTATSQGWIDPETDSRGRAAVLWYGPQAIGDATVVRAYVNGETLMRFLPEQTGRTVELVLGSEFGRLASPTEVNRNLVALGEPTRPPGC